VVTHELGHLLGLDSVTPSLLPHDWMTATLAPGVRRYPDISIVAMPHTSAPVALDRVFTDAVPALLPQIGAGGTHSLDLVFASAEPIFDYTNSSANGNHSSGSSANDLWTESYQDALLLGDKKRDPWTDGIG
jgi:hypothetical protein